MYAILNSIIEERWEIQVISNNKILREKRGHGFEELSPLLQQIAHCP